MSNDDLMLDVGQANEIKMFFRRSDWTNQDIKAFTEGDSDLILKYVRGLAEINIVKHVIDCSTDPFVPDSWSGEEHKKGEQLEFNPEKFEFKQLAKRFGVKPKIRITYPPATNRFDVTLPRFL